MVRGSSRLAETVPAAGLPRACARRPTIPRSRGCRISGSGAGSRSCAIAAGERPSGIGCAQPMAGVVRPPPARMISPPAEAEPAEKARVQEDSAVEPVQSPAPAAPSQAAEKAANVDTRAESVSKSVAEVRVIPWRIIAVSRRSPNIFGIIVRHVDHFRISRLNVDGRLITLLLGSDRLLPVGAQFAGRLSLGAHALHGLHYIRLLSQECIADISGPANVGRQSAEHVREDHQGLYAGIPVLLASRIHQIGTLKVAVPLQPLGRFGDLQRIGRSGQDLAEQAIRV